MLHASWWKNTASMKQSYKKKKKIRPEADQAQGPTTHLQENQNTMKRVQWDHREFKSSRLLETLQSELSIFKNRECERERIREYGR